MSDGRSRAVARTKVAVIWTDDQYCVKRCGFCTVILSYDVPNNGGIMGNSPSGMASRQSLGTNKIDQNIKITLK